MSIQEQNRERIATNSIAKKSIKETPEFIKKEIVKTDAQLNQHIADDGDFSKKEEILTIIPGVGKNVARVLLATVSELDELNATPPRRCHLTLSI